uniref:(northern house mosquito) hypothetical protein n=1 Tax=Culex pipiens TaxID=7175 RepID=A0A8D8IPX5_CULPI
MSGGAGTDIIPGGGFLSAHAVSTTGQIRRPRGKPIETQRGALPPHVLFVHWQPQTNFSQPAEVIAHDGVGAQFKQIIVFKRALAAFASERGVFVYIFTR